MIIDRAGRSAVSSLGFADRLSFLVADLTGRRWRTVPVESTVPGYLSVHGGRGDVFAVQQHDGKAGTVRIGVRGFDDPETELAAVEVAADGTAAPDAFTGDAALWAQVPTAFISHLVLPGRAPEYVILTVDPAQQTVRTHQLPWFDESFDRSAQAPTGAARVPAADGNGDVVAVSVARDDRLFLHDVGSGRLVREVSLTGGHGAHTPVFSADGTRAWTIDYDTAVFLDARTWSVTRSRRLQRPDEHVAMFVGAPTPTADETLCVIARPGRGDVLGLSTDSCRVTVRAVMDRQPVEAAASPEGTVFARDWRTGAPLWGRWQTV